MPRRRCSSRPYRASSPILAVFLLALSCFLPTSLAQAAKVECDDSSLTTYLLALIDTLYANGLTHFESLVAKASESDSGYDLISSWYTDQTLTLFVPTDAAFQTAGIVPPFGMLSEKAIADLVALHTADGRWDYAALPNSPAKGFADSQLALADMMNSTVNSTARVPLVVQQGDQQAMSVRLATGNATTWGWVIQGEKEIWNIVIVPIDTVLPIPPKLSSALSLATTSRSVKGLPVFQKALDAAGGARQLEDLTPGGFTIFAPIDDAFTPDVSQALASESAAVILGNHYATNYSLFSRIWVDNGPFEMPVVSGEKLLVQQADSGATVTIGNQTVRILRSDIVLENGVMHIVEEVLADPKVVATATKNATPSKTDSAQPSGSGTPAKGQGVVEGAASRRAGVGMGMVAVVIIALSLAVL